MTAELKEYVHNGLKTGFFVSRDGKIKGKYNYKIAYTPPKTNHLYVSLDFNNKIHKLNLAKIVFNTFNEEVFENNAIFNGDVYFYYKDGDYTNCSFDNLIRVSKSELMLKSFYANKKTHFTEEEIDEIRKIASEIMPAIGFRFTVDHLHKKYEVSKRTIRHILNNKTYCKKGE